MSTKPGENSTFPRKAPPSPTPPADIPTSQTLVSINGFVPDQGESVLDLAAKNPAANCQARSPECRSSNPTATPDSTHTSTPLSSETCSPASEPVASLAGALLDERSMSLRLWTERNRRVLGARYDRAVTDSLDVRRPELRGVRRSGTVRWYKDDRGYGRITAD